MKNFESQLIQLIPRLRRYARALTSSAHGSDDLVQDTLERALKKKSLWRSDTELRPWLFTIMHNVFINTVRSHNRQPPMDALDENICDQAMSPEALQIAQQLKHYVNDLPDEQKEVFLLVSLEGFSYSEVADIMKIPIGTVMSRLSRARSRLRQQITTQQQCPLRRVK